MRSCAGYAPGTSCRWPSAVTWRAPTRAVRGWVGFDVSDFRRHPELARQAPRHHDRLDLALLIVDDLDGLSGWGAGPVNARLAISEPADDTTAIAAGLPAGEWWTSGRTASI